MTTPATGPGNGPGRSRALRTLSLRRAWRAVGASLRPPPEERPLVAEAPAMTLGQVVKRYWPWFKPLRGWLVLGLVLLAAAPLIEIVEVLLFGRLVDDVLVPADAGPLLTIALIYLGLNLLSAVISGVDDYLHTWISQRFLVSLRTDVYRSVLAQPQYLHEQRRLGDVLSRITSDASAVNRFMVSSFTDTVASVIRLCFFLIALFLLSWELAAVSLIVAPLFWLIATRFARRVKTVSRERVRRGGSLGAVAEEHLANVPLVQAYDLEAQAVTDFNRQNRAIADAELAASRVRSIFLPVVDFAELAGVLCVVALGTWTLSTDRLTLGELLAFLTLMAQTYRPIRDLSSLIPSLYSATAGVERLTELLDAPGPELADDPIDLTDAKGEVHFEAVTARYPGGDTDALRGVDISVAAGELVAIAGPSGAGKSTLARLLTRGLDPVDGRVTIDGHDVRSLSLSSLRRTVTIVLQETLLIDASIADNIVLARPDASRDDVEQAAIAANAHEFIVRQPQGYDTRIGQRGRSLSGGQRQRLSLARALLRDSPVLILDEPTTGLDADSAHRVLAPLRDAVPARTVIIVTHDPVALAVADRVVHLDHGVVTSTLSQVNGAPTPKVAP